MTLEELVFHVKGSSQDGYEVTFIKDGASLTALCTCPAGQYGNLCKHRVTILDGKTEAITSDNADKVSTVTGWLVGTDVAAAIAEMREAEKSTECTKEELADLKKKLARAMNS